jgi:hypothetical protein
MFQRRKLRWFKKNLNLYFLFCSAPNHFKLSCKKCSAKQTLTKFSEKANFTKTKELVFIIYREFRSIRKTFCEILLLYCLDSDVGFCWKYVYWANFSDPLQNIALAFSTGELKCGPNIFVSFKSSLSRFYVLIISWYLLNLIAQKIYCLKTHLPRCTTS